MTFLDSLSQANAQANALVVGATQGIGLGFVKALLLQPGLARVYATYRSSSTAIALFALQETFPEKLHLLAVDITQEDQIAGMAEHIREASGCLHLVINCVGILHDEAMQPEKNLRQIESAQLLRSFQINSIGTLLLVKYLLPVLKHCDRSIFAALSAKIGSIEDNRLGGWYGYRASKAALNMFLRTAAIEYSRKSPKTLLVALHPGTTDTHLSKPFQRNVPPEKLFPVTRTVAQLMAVLDGLKETDSGKFFSWDGSQLPW